MEFWIFFVCVCIGFVFIEKLVSRKYKMFVPMCFMFFITFMAAFRYQIGSDYQAYEKMFYDVGWETSYIELSFRIIVIFLREWGFDFQALFVVYAVLTALFSWKGIKYYLPAKSLSLKILFMTISQPSLYWISLSGMRQALAMAIFFWCSKYIVERKFFKYIFGIFLATFFHLSAVVLIPYYWVVHKSFDKYQHIILVLICIILSSTDIVQSILSVALNYFTGYGGYIAYGSAGRQVMDTVFLIELITWVTVIFYTKHTLDAKKEIVVNMYTMLFVHATLFMWSKAIARISLYSAVFMSLAFLNFTDIFTINSQKTVKSLIIIGLVLLFLWRVYKIVDHPDLNTAYAYINYTFNFKVFQ